MPDLENFWIANNKFFGFIALLLPGLKAYESNVKFTYCPWSVPDHLRSARTST